MSRFGFRARGKVKLHWTLKLISTQKMNLLGTHNAVQSRKLKLLVFWAALWLRNKFIVWLQMSFPGAVYCSYMLGTLQTKKHARSCWVLCIFYSRFFISLYKENAFLDSNSNWANKFPVVRRTHLLFNTAEKIRISWVRWVSLCMNMTDLEVELCKILLTVLFI